MLALTTLRSATLTGLLVTPFALLACHSPASSRPPPPSRPLASRAPVGANNANLAARTPAPTLSATPDPVPTTVPPTPPSPAYDRDADVRERIAVAKKELGASTWTAMVDESFLLAGAPIAEAFVRRATDAYFNDRFSKRPARVVSVYLFASAAPYERYCNEHLGGPCISPYGFYLADVRRIVMNAGPGLGTLTHELVHPIVETDFPSAPAWIDEGIASLFEAPVVPRPGEIHGVRNWRLPRLRGAFASPVERRRARLELLFGMRNETFRGPDEPLHYAMARYACQWLDARGFLWPFYQRWRDAFAEDPTGERSFAAVVGVTPAEAHAAWEMWVRGL